LTVILLIAGLLAYRSMPAETFPEINQPEIFITTIYPGNAPLDMERLVTRPIEKEVKGLSGVDKVTSTSSQGFSTIRVKFDFSVAPSEALRKVKDKVDAAQATADFPKDLPAAPNVAEFKFSELVPIQNINLSGNYTPTQLNEYAEYLEEQIENLPEISKVDIRGMDAREVAVRLDMQQMQAMSISFGDVAQAIQSENMSISGGDILVDGYRRNVRISGEMNEVAELSELVVKHEKGNLVYLKDIAEVKFGEVEKESYSREYTKPVVTLDVVKRGGENLIAVSDKIRLILADARANTLPDDVQVTVTNDQSNRTRNQLGELENSILFGVLLVVLVLMFFLGLRNALFVGIAIPLSMLLSFFVLGAMGVTLNTMVLFALVLALGMLVDNGIVVVENIYRYTDLGYDLKTAARKGTGEIAIPIIASTATTVAAFLPLAIWPGLIGEFMKYLPITLVIVLSSSLFVALVVNPALASRYMKVKEEGMDVKKWSKRGFWAAGIGLPLNLAGYALEGSAATALHTLGNLLFYSGGLTAFYVLWLHEATERFRETNLPKLEKFYGRIVGYALRAKNVNKMYYGTIGLLVASVALLVVFPPKVVFFPSNEPNLANIYIEMPIGTDIEETNALTKRIEDRVLKVIDKYAYNQEGARYNYMVESVIAQVGAGTGDPRTGNTAEKTPHKAKVIVAFRETAFRVDKEGNKVLSSVVLDDLRANMKGFPGAVIAVDKDAAGPPVGPPINVEFSGDDYYQVLAAAEDARAFIQSQGFQGIDELKLDVESGKPEMPIEIDRTKARSLGVSTGQVGDAIRPALFGKEVDRFKDGEDDYPINLRLQDEYRYNMDNLLSQRITFRDQASGKIKQVPISAVATASKASTFSGVKRKEGDRVITLFSGVTEGANANELVALIKQTMETYPLPDGVTVSFTGEQEEQAKELSFLSKALLGAVFLIYLIIVGQFNSTKVPRIIMTTVGLSLIGVFLGLVIFRMDFVIIMTMIGLISLAGVVVNNAIVLADYYGQLVMRRKAELGLAEEAMLTLEETRHLLAETGATRLRPVLLTAITTVLGLIPLAIGLNINFFTLFSQNDPQIYVGGDTVMFWGPLSWTVIFGLTFATFLTLVLVPVQLYRVEAKKVRRAERRTLAA
jgi:multidrug efflux pump subunit AcrB